jgi:hypothetical protein
MRIARAAQMPLRIAAKVPRREIPERHSLSCFSVGSAPTPLLKRTIVARLLKRIFPRVRLLFFSRQYALADQVSIDRDPGRGRSTSKGIAVRPVITAGPW